MSIIAGVVIAAIGILSLRFVASALGAEGEMLDTTAFFIVRMRGKYHYY